MSYKLKKKVSLNKLSLFLTLAQATNSFSQAIAWMGPSPSCNVVTLELNQPKIIIKVNFTKFN